jgi:geranylgeranyl diphosphate synthase type II
MLELKTYLERCCAEINSYLEKCLPAFRACHPALLEAMQYSVLGGGKRLRAILAITVSRMFHGQDGNIFPAAAALEMIHAYSLVHDDLPAMDNDDYRRGKLSTHKKFGEALAILAGDALLTHAFWVIAAHTEDKKLVAPMIEILGWGAGIGGMVSGQVADILGEYEIPTPALLDFIHTHKTGALIEASCQVGAIAAGISLEHMRIIREYGCKIGLAFQIIDDILDITGKKEKIGKTVGKDTEQNKITYPRIFGLAKAEEKASCLIEEACQAIASIANNEHLTALARFVHERQY